MTLLERIFFQRSVVWKRTIISYDCLLQTESPYYQSHWASIFLNKTEKASAEIKWRKFFFLSSAPFVAVCDPLFCNSCKSLVNLAEIDEKKYFSSCAIAKLYHERKRVKMPRLMIHFLSPPTGYVCILSIYGIDW